MGVEGEEPALFTAELSPAAAGHSHEPGPTRHFTSSGAFFLGCIYRAANRDSRLWDPEVVGISAITYRTFLLQRGIPSSGPVVTFQPLFKFPQCTRAHSLPGGPILGQVSPSLFRPAAVLTLNLCEHPSCASLDSLDILQACHKLDGDMPSSQNTWRMVQIR